MPRSEGDEPSRLPGLANPAVYTVRPFLHNASLLLLLDLHNPIPLALNLLHRIAQLKNIRPLDALKGVAGV